MVNDIMSTRGETTAKIFEVLEARVNCENIISFLEKHKVEGSTKISVRNREMDIFIIGYDDYTGDLLTNKNKQTKDNLFKYYDFISDANHTGFEYFPYLYGVLDCHSGNNSKIYTIQEPFDGTLGDLVTSLDQQKEWFTIIFQMVLIHYYFSVITGCNYKNATIQNHFYKKSTKKYPQRYKLDGHEFEFFSDITLVLGEFNLVNDATEQNPNNLQLLVSYIGSNPNIIKPSSSQMAIIAEVIESPKSTPTILKKYYGTTHGEVSKDTSTSSVSGYL